MTEQPEHPAAERRFLPRTSNTTDTFVGELLRRNTVGGAVILTAAVVAIIWANTPWAETYEHLRDYKLGPLTVEKWAADGALALFFYLAGLELKREFLVGSLKEPSKALVPIVAAALGVVVPALVYVTMHLVWPSGAGDLKGWAVPAATDIAFALAVLAIVGRALPKALRSFLLTLAVVDDLIVIIIIAVFYSSKFKLIDLVIALALLAVFALMQRTRKFHWAFYIPLAIAIWWFTHESGIHATVAGVAMGMVTRVVPTDDETHSPAEALEHRLTPFSAGLAVPFFALMSAGVPLRLEGLGTPIFWGIALGLMIGKPIGVMGGAWLVTKVTPSELDPGITWKDVFGLSMIAGVGFTVSLLVAELSFEDSTLDGAKTAVLGGSLLAALVGASFLRQRDRVYAKRADGEDVDSEDYDDGNAFDGKKGDTEQASSRSDDAEQT